MGMSLSKLRELVMDREAWRTARFMGLQRVGHDRVTELTELHCQVHTISVLYCAHLCMKYSLGISNFLEEISSLSYSIVFLNFFALIAEEGFLLSPCYSLELCIQMDISFLFSFAFHFFSFHSYF